MKYLSINDVSCRGKRVLLREDFNVPIENGVISNDARILAALPTIKSLSHAGAKVMILSHLGRPTEGQITEKFSLAPVAKRLSELLSRPVPLITDTFKPLSLKDGDVVLFENSRFHIGEEDNDPTLSKQFASLCDIFVMDAFATAHRSQASTHGVAKAAPLAIAGPLLQREIEALDRILAHPTPPCVAIVGGAKVSSKLELLKNILPKIDHLIVGGGIANTFLAAEGFEVGSSLIERDLIESAKAIMKEATRLGKSIPLPVDVKVAATFDSHAIALEKAVTDITPTEMILDVGQKTSLLYASLIEQAGTILWNGPIGVFEFPAFKQGTENLAKAIAHSRAFSVAGGGDTLSAIEECGISDNISYLSTGGGAFLTYLEQGTLPALEVLQCR